METAQLTVVGNIILVCTQIIPWILLVVFWFYRDAIRQWRKNITARYTAAKQAWIINSSIPGREWRSVRREVRRIAYHRIPMLIRKRHRAQKDWELLYRQGSREADRLRLEKIREDTHLELDKLNTYLADASSHAIALSWQDQHQEPDRQHLRRLSLHVQQLEAAEQEVENLDIIKRSKDS